MTGGIESFAAVWLVVVPLEAALSASRRVVAFAVGARAAVRQPADRARPFRLAAGAGCRSGAARCLDGVRRGIGDALCGGSCVRRRIAGAHQRGAALCRGRPLSPAGAQHERRDLAPSPQRRGAVHFAGGRSLLGAPAARAARPRPVRPRPCRRPPGLSHGACRMPRAAAMAAASSSACAATAAGGARQCRSISSGSRCAAARSSTGATSRRGRSRRRDARRHRAQAAGAGARSGARRRRAGRCRQDPLPRHHEPRAAHAAQRHHRLLRDDHAGRRC